MTNKEQLVELTKKLSDEGKLIEVGFAALRTAVIPPDASEIQVREMRMAFMAGAQHLFASMLSVMEPGSDPTEADLRRMSLISAELEAFTRELKLRLAPKG